MKTLESFIRVVALHRLSELQRLKKFFERPDWTKEEFVEQHFKIEDANFMNLMRDPVTLANLSRSTFFLKELTEYNLTDRVKEEMKLLENTVMLDIYKYCGRFVGSGSETLNGFICQGPTGKAHVELQFVETVDQEFVQPKIVVKGEWNVQQ